MMITAATKVLIKQAQADPEPSLTAEFVIEVDGVVLFLSF